MCRDFSRDLPRNRRISSGTMSCDQRTDIFYGMFSVSILEILDRVITASNCNTDKDNL